MFKENKICFIVPSLKGGGLERVVALLANYYTSTLHQQVYIVLLSDQEIFYEINSSVKIYKPFFKKKPSTLILRYVKLFFFVRRVLEKISPSAIISFGESYNAFVIFSSFFLKMPVYVSNRASPFSSLNGFRGIINPLFYPFAEAVIMQTQLGINILSKKYKFTNFKKIGNPFTITNKPSQILSRAKIIVSVGSLGGKKNQDLLIRYFADIQNDGWELHIVGDGPNYDALERIITELNLSNKVFLLGSRSDVANILQNAQIFAFTSTSEGFPNALGEAMAAGCACISFDCVTGPAELIENGINGFLIKVGEDEVYKSKLAMLMKDEELRQEFNTNAKDKIKEFSIDKIAKKYLELMFPET